MINVWEQPENRFVGFLILIMVGLGFLGGMFYVQHKVRFSHSHFSTAEILRSRLLFHQLRRVEYLNAHLESQAAEIRLRDKHLFDTPEDAEERRLSRFMGLAQQEGPGLQVTLNDSSKPLLLGDNPNGGIIHNTDLAFVANELRAAGAKAIAINHQPLMSETGITCAGPIIIINGTRLTPPFEVQALGDVQRMRDYMNRNNGFLQELKKYGIEPQVAETKVSIPAASEPSALEAK